MIIILCIIIKLSGVNDKNGGGRGAGQPVSDSKSDTLPPSNQQVFISPFCP